MAPVSAFVVKKLFYCKKLYMYLLLVTVVLLIVIVLYCIVVFCSCNCLFSSTFLFKKFLCACSSSGQWSKFFKSLCVSSLSPGQFPFLSRSFKLGCPYFVLPISFVHLSSLHRVSFSRLCYLPFV